MTTIKYPLSLDSDAELPRADDDITEISTFLLNQLRSATFAIEKALGAMPQGTSSDLKSRLDVSLDSNGNIKASSLIGIGLIGLPINNSEIGSTAGIEEAKLDLNYNTSLLKQWIDALQIRTTVLENALAIDIAHLNQHIAHPAIFGRHMSSDVDAYGVFINENVQGALTTLHTTITDHIAAPTSAHAGSSISLDNHQFSTITADNVQTAVKQLEDINLVEIIHHRTRGHTNGILNTQEAFLSTGRGVTILSPATTIAATAGDTFIKFASTPPSAAFQSIRKNDRIDFTTGGQTYSFVIDSTQSSNQINIFGTVPVSGAGTAAVYRNAEETSEPSVAMVCLRKDTIASRPSTLQMVQPSAAYLLSSGFRGSQLSTSAKYIRLLYPNGDTNNLDVYTAMTALSTVKSTWTAENVARVINHSLLSPGIGYGIGYMNYPLVAFAYKGELGFAYDSPDSDGYVAIGIPTSADATAVLGFIPDEIGYSAAPRNLYIDGYEIPKTNPILNAQGKITASDTITFYGTNPLALGATAGLLAHVSLHAVGTYVIKGSTSNTLTFDSVNEHDFSADLNQLVRVKVYADAFSLASAPDNRTLYEIFLDGYADGYGPVASVRGSSRASYVDTSGSASSLEGFFDLTAVARTFGSTSRRLFYDSVAKTAVLGEAVVGPSITNIGAPVDIPTSPQGFRFSVYDAYGIDYFEFEMTGAPSGDGFMDITSYPRISEGKFLQLATVLHNKTRFDYLTDTRQFGTVGRQDVGDDFIRDYITYPRSILRSNGVIYGLSSSGIGFGVLSVDGGQVLVNGQLKSVSSSSFTIPLDGVATYNLFADTNGVLRFLRNDYFALGVLATPSLAELLVSKTETALAQVTVNSSNLITAIVDIRKFVDDLDSKGDLIVEEEGVTHGSFASLVAAIAYISGLPTNSPCSRTIKVRGTIFLSTSVTLPDHTILEGDGKHPQDSGSQITYLSSSATIALGNGATIRNLLFYRSGTLSSGFLSGNLPTALRIENCQFLFAVQDSGNIALSFLNWSDAVITGCKFISVGQGIVVTAGGTGGIICNNNFDGINLNGIYFGSSIGVHYTIVSDNIFVTASFDYSSPDAAFINASKPLDFDIKGNMFVGTAVVAGGNMIKVATAGSTCRILDNVFYNMNPGFAKAILLSDNTGATVGRNYFLGFDGASNATMSFSSCSSLLIESNMVYNCCKAIYATACQYISIMNNNILSKGVSGVASSALTLAGSTTNMFRICGNHIANLTDTTGLNSAPLININGGGVGGIISDNVIEILPASAPSAIGLLYIEQSNCIVDNNIFSGATFSNDVISVGDPSYTGIIICNNNLINTTMSTALASKIVSAALDTVDFMNRGQTYIISVPISNTNVESEWFWVSVNDSVIPCSSTITSYDKRLTIYFGSEIPRGAIITNVRIGYSLTGTTGDMTATWFYATNIENRSSAITVRSATNLTGGGLNYTDLTPTSTPLYMLVNMIHYITVIAKTTGSGNKYIFGIDVTYKL